MSSEPISPAPLPADAPDHRSDMSLGSGAQPRSGIQRRWTAQWAATVLGLQAAFFVGVLAWAMLRGSWVAEWRLETLAVSLSVAALAAAHYLLIFGPLALLVLASILIIFLRPRAGWVFGMAVQCVVLFLGLEIYFIERGDDVVELPILYLMLLGSILIVVFLNSPEGRLLLVRSAPAALHGDHPGGEQP